jgi:hypothetical protein
VAALVGASVLSARAQVVTLNDNTSQATVNLFGGPGLAGMNSWKINGQSQLNQQWFWFRVGNDPTGQHSLDTLGAPTIVSTTANFLDAIYHGSGFNIEITYSLQGGATTSTNWSSDISETISIHNTSANPLNMHFFQYSDFALLGSQGNEQVNIYQNGVFFSQATVNKVSSLTQISETVAQPLADHAEAGLISDSPNTYNRLTSGVPITLNDITTAGPSPLSDATWALEWDPVIAAGESVDILKDKLINVVQIPEPSSAALLLGGAALFALRRKR